MSELPVGLMMTLAMHERAMERFSQLSEAERQGVIARARSVSTKQEMQALVDGLVR